MVVVPRGRWLSVGLLGVLLTAWSGGAQDVAVRAGEACEGLDAAACCAQTLETHAFHETGEGLPKAGQLVAKLACRSAKPRMPQHACRQLLVARGWSTPGATQRCQGEGLAARCRGQRECKDCVAALTALGFQTAEGVCYAAIVQR